MDDLSGLNWSSSSSTTTNNQNKGNVKPSSSAYSSFPSSLRPTPSPLGSGRNTPLSVAALGGGSAPLSSQGSGAAAAAAAPKPAPLQQQQDSFSSLINFGNTAAKNAAKLSLYERQQQLEAEKKRKEEERRKLQQAHYGDGQFFDALGRGSTGTSRTGSPAIVAPAVAEDDDLFAAFNKDTKVDNASFYPPDASTEPKRRSPATAAADDDPFGLIEFSSQTKASSTMATSNGGDDGDDDVLGALSRPVEEFRTKAAPSAQHKKKTTRSEPEPGKPIEHSDSDSDSDSGAPPPRRGGNDPFDKAVAQLVEYGFTPENARKGLTESGGGLNVQAAVNWLLDDAHRQAKEKARGAQGGSGGADRAASRGRHTHPSWMREDDARSSSAGGAGGAGTDFGDGDFAKTAAAVGTSLLKTANSLWKTSQKRVQKAVQEFQQDGGDPSQPRWMRSAALEQAEFSEGGSSRRRNGGGSGDGGGRGASSSPPSAAAAAAVTAAATDEALMLESGIRPDRKPHPPAPQQQRPSAPAEVRRDASRSQSPATGGGHFSNSGPPSRNSPVPRWQQQSGGGGSDPRSRLTKQAIEEESSQAYISPSRRRKAGAGAGATPSPAPTPAPRQPTAVAEGDLLSNSTALPQRSTVAAAAAAATTRSAPARPTPAQPAASRRRPVPQVDSLVLKASAQHRAAGAAHFKRGDYAAAHEAYTASLAGIPASHPLLAVLFSNRALTALKTGAPRQAVADADAALAVIGPGRGEGEQVSLEDGTGTVRDLKDLYAKALTRKAEALEQMEKWAEAGAVWQQCVEGGLGGPAATAGRQRCQKALAPKPATAASSKPAARPAAKPAARPAPAANGNAGQDSEAVQRLREANRAAEREDSEKLALIDKVDARIAAWRDGKKDNLRALLGSLDTVLWEGSGWKKAGLHELVMANKVKVIYMKAIAKTHPDKIPKDASTEVRMIAGSVFSTLNEGWDKFKAENKM